MHPSPLNKIPKLQQDIMRFQLLQTLLMLTSLQALVLLNMPAAFATPQIYPIAKSHCDDNCGNVSIPYPFGTSEDCYNDPNFKVTCKNTSGDNPPKLFLKDSDIEITKISLDGQATVLQDIAYNCYSADTGKLKEYASIPLPFYFTVNNTANKFTIVGCDSYGFISGWKNIRKFNTSCIATCRSLSDVEDGDCTGSGCCQISIPKNVWKVNISVRSYNNYRDVRDISNCTFGFLIDQSAFNFSRQNLTNLKNVEKLPMVVDWAIGQVDCTGVQKNSSDYACKSINSICDDPKNRYGYRCRCLDGYRGNPYINDGCQDIDECSPDEVQKCEHVCINTKGNFSCKCKDGFYGEGIINVSRCIPNPDESYILKLAAGIPTGIILLLVIVCLAYMEYTRKHSKKMKQIWSTQNGRQLFKEELKKIGLSEEKFRIFNSSELSKATNNFKESNIIDEGRFNIVYQGVLPNKTTIAITKSKRVHPNRNDKQVEQLGKEVIVLYQIDHENMVKFLGCCFETEIPHLVYEFISSNTLSARLREAERAHMLTWEKRLKIAVEIADVLLHLHSTHPSPIIHGNVKSDNILLMDNYTAKVANFGASRLISLNETQIFTDVQGTKGYLDPEYFITEQLTTKSDIYSFGVVLLELVTGRKAFREDAPLEERSLVVFSQRMMKQNSFVQFSDGNIASHIHAEQVKEVAELAESCIKMNGDERPCMKMVAEKLKRLKLRKSQSSTEQNTPEGFYGITTFDSGGSTGAGSGSFVDPTIPPMSGGR